MHRLDSFISDIESRLLAVCNNTAIQEEASLQESLSSYGWILLDSWIAWRTLRFLLRDTVIDDSVNEKWYKTPSSYTSSQIRAIWKLSESTICFIEDKYGKSLKHMIDQVVQTKRNAGAHFSQGNPIMGRDAQDIKSIYLLLSKVFLMYEVNCFLSKLESILVDRGYCNFIIEYSSGKSITIDDFLESIESFYDKNEFFLKCTKDNKIKVLYFMQSGCRAGDDNGILYDVYDETHSYYCFMNNKGYYLDSISFVDAVEKCWVKEGMTN